MPHVPIRSGNKDTAPTAISLWVTPPLAFDPDKLCNRKVLPVLHLGANVDRYASITCICGVYTVPSN